MAVPIWNGRVSPVFDSAGRVLLCEVDGGRIEGRSEEPLEPGPPWQRAQALAAKGAEVLICGAISRPLAEMVAAAGIRLYPFVAGEVEAVLRAFAEGRLESPAFAMPGCRRHRWRYRAGRRHGWA